MLRDRASSSHFRPISVSVSGMSILSDFGYSPWPIACSTNPPLRAIYVRPPWMVPIKANARLVGVGPKATLSPPSEHYLPTPMISRGAPLRNGPIGPILSLALLVPTLLSAQDTITIGTGLDTNNFFNY